MAPLQVAVIQAAASESSLRHFRLSSDSRVAAGPRAFSLLIESEAKLQIIGLKRFLRANRHPSSGKARGHASLENALG